MGELTGIISSSMCKNGYLKNAGRVKLMIQKVFINYLVICFIGILLFPMVVFTDEEGEKQGDPTPIVVDKEDEKPPYEIIVGYSKEMRRFVDKEDKTVTPMLIEALDKHKCSYAKEGRKVLDKKDNIVTTILIGDADLHRHLPVDNIFGIVGSYMGFLKADKIMFVDDNLSGERLLTIAVGNVNFLRGNIYITSHCAYQNHMDGQNRTKHLITFEGDVRIANVTSSVNKVRHKLFEDGYNIDFESKDVSKVYDAFKELSLKFLCQFEKDKESHEVVLSSIFHYDSMTGKRIVEGGVSFKIYHNPYRRENENAENESDTSSSSGSNSSDSEPQTEK